MNEYLAAPPVGPPDADYHHDTVRAFQGIPTIERTPKGRLWAAWYGGGTGEDRHNYVLLASSDDEGAGWSQRLVVDPDRDGPVRAYDPCLWRDPTGALHLFWAQGYEKHTDERAGVWRITTVDSDATEPEWSTPARICDGIMMNKPIVTASGTWLLPAAKWGSEESAQVYASVDDGASWSFRGAASVPNPDDRSCDEHMIVERTDGSLLMLVRTSYGIGESVSTDEGATWTPVRPSGLEHPVSRFFIRRLASGRLILVKHGPLDERTGRSHLTAYLSGDDGRTWDGGLEIDERTGVSYPDGVEAPDGTIYLIYDFDRRGAKEILLARFDESDILAQEGRSPVFARRLLVNRATGTA